MTTQVRKVLVTDYTWPSLDIEREVLREVEAEVVTPSPSSGDSLASLARDADAIMTCFAPVTRELLSEAPKCLVVARYGIGVDNIDVDACTELGILVTNVPDYCVDEVSDHVMAMLLAWNRRLAHFDAQVKKGQWDKTDLNVPVVRLRGRKLGIVGFGKIGKAVCQKAKAFGLEVLAFDPYVSAETATALGARLVDLPRLLQESDFVTLHTPLTSETRHIIGEKQLMRMKPSAFLINAARGPLVDEKALYRALTQGWIAGAGLDVLEEAPPPPDYPLLQLDNVIITPHVAFFSQQSLQELERRSAAEVARVLRGEMPENVVNKQALGKARAKLKRM